MYKIRYAVSNGQVNLITSGTEEVPVAGCAYMEIKAHPVFDDTVENLFVKNGKVIAVKITPDGKEHVHDA